MNGWQRAMVGVCVFAVFSGSAGAYKPAPERSYTKVSPDGRYVFVMLGTVSGEAETKPYIEEVRQEIRRIRAKYNRSGLYRTDDSNEPLWTVDWYDYAVNVFVASDGVHLVRVQRRWRSSAPATINFYSRGQLVRCYQCGPLVAIQNEASKRFDLELFDEDLEFSLRTPLGDSYLFDIQTGELIHSFRWWRWLCSWFVVAVAAVLVVLLIRRWRRLLAKQGEGVRAGS